MEMKKLDIDNWNERGGIKCHQVHKTASKFTERGKRINDREVDVVRS